MVRVILKSYLLFFLLIITGACSESAENDSLKIAKERLDLEKRKLELEEAKFNANLNQSLDNINKKTESDLNQEKASSDQPKSNVKGVYKFLLGKWKGTLRDKKIVIFLENIDGKSVTGYNIVGKNKRPIKGLIYEDDRTLDGECGGMIESFKLVLSEPGDDKWDGVFTLYFVKCPSFDGNGNEIDVDYYATGDWVANTGKSKGNIELSK